MKHFVSSNGHRVMLVVFERGELLLEGLTEVVKREHIDTAAITGGIGSLQNVNIHAFAKFGFPVEEKSMKFTGAVEVGSIQGTVIGGQVHAHISFFHWDTRETWVGHLEEGARVAYLAEVTLLVADGVHTQRYRDEAGDYRVRAVAT